MAQEAVTECWPQKEEKTPESHYIYILYYFLHISSNYAKIFVGKLFCTWEYPRNGSKTKNGEKRKKKERDRERKLVITMAKLRMAYASTHGRRKPPGPKRRSALVPLFFKLVVNLERLER